MRDVEAPVISVEWKRYRRNGFTEMRPYVPGEDLSKISVSAQDEPKLGDMIARDPDNPKDKWLVNKEYFEKRMEEVD